MKALSAATAAAIVLTACGGGESDPATGAVEVFAGQRLVAQSAAAAKDVSATPATPAASTASDPATQLMDFAEAHFAQYFPSKQVNHTSDSLVYRYYPETGIYLMVDGQKIFVAGGPFAPSVLYVGLVSDYIQTTPTTVITAAQWAKCPDGASSASNFYSCMVGTATGTQVFDTSQSCSFSIGSDGTMTLSSGSTSFALKPPFGAVAYNKSQGISFFRISVQSLPALQIDSMQLAVSAPTLKNFFTDGGTLQVDANQVPTGKSLSCKFEIAKG